MLLALKTELTIATSSDQENNCNFLLCLSETGPVQVHQVQVQLLCTSFIYFVLYLNTFYLSIFYLVSVKSTNVLKYQYLSTRVKYHVYQ